MENFPRKPFNISSTHSTSKTVMSGEDTLTLDSQTKKNVEIVKKVVNELAHNFNFDTKKLMHYVLAKGTPVIFAENAQKKLKKQGWDIGFIPGITGIRALFLNMAVQLPWSFESVPMIVFDSKKVPLDVALLNFYKWYAHSMNLPGMDERAQTVLHKVSSGKINMKSLKLDDMTALREALHRDKEATDFALGIVREMEAAKKIKDSGDTKM